MGENVIALMFPEYKDAGNPGTSKVWVTEELYDDETIGEQIKQTGIFVDFFKDENCRMIYDAKNVKAYLYVANTLPECYPSRARQLRTILKGVENWRENRKSTEDKEYIVHHETIKDDIRTEIAERELANFADSFLIASTVVDRDGEKWNLRINDTSVSVEALRMFIPQVFDWFSEHHKPRRVYEWNEKHGENGKFAHSDNKGDEVSVLLCSKSHAAEMLNGAIGEPMYDCLYCFDAEYGKYMEYKAGCKYGNLPCDAKERTYHSYHIDDEHQIPNRVMKKIKILQDQIEST